eukprot:433936_1
MSHREEFNKRGFIHLKQVIPDDVIAAMQKECNHLLIANASKYGDSSFIDNTGCIIEPTFDVPNGLYLSSSYCEHRKKLKLNEIVSKYIIGEYIKNILLKLTNSKQIFLLNEQYIVKPSNTKNTKFVWHQDSNYLPQPNLYISVWMPLDDITTQNGSIYMVPFSNNLNINSWKIPSLLLKNEEILKLQTDITTGNEKDIDEFDDKKMSESENSKTDKKIILFESNKLQLLPKVGDIIIFTSYTYHKSNCNLSNKMRRVLMAQYSTFPIIDRVNKKLARLVVKL